MKTQAELDFEKQVVETLTTGHNQWTERKDLYEATPDDLWNNLRDKINNNNHANLHGQLLTDNEFAQVKRAIDVLTPYDAAKLLAAENGIGKVVIDRDDASLGKVTLELFWKADVAGGKSSYEIVRQAIRPKGLGTSKLDHDRRFDVTLLINGLPLIQLEFKKSTVELNQAFNQVVKYSKEGKYTGIYAMLQMFVIMSPDSSEYFAAAAPDKFNKSFTFKWRTKDNQPVQDGLDFTKQVLNIPMAHKLVSEYTVMDEDRKNLIILRPYQIYAIEAVMHRLHEHENGFVWHTTGSGKTLTSYKTSKLAAQDPSVDRVIFLLDRKELDEQTTASFTAYAANDDIQIKEAANTGDLIKKLMMNDGKVLVTSIQKMSRVVKRQAEAAENGRGQRLGKIFSKRVVFFVDEAHRSQFGKMQKDIRDAFYNSNWYGYTGTPIFTENAKQIHGELPVTTEEMFGKCCHKYTIKDALDDNAVLPFNVEHNSDISRGQLEELIEDKEKKKLTERKLEQGAEFTEKDMNAIKGKVATLSDVEREKYLSNSYFETDKHINQVVQYILKYGPRKTSLGNGNFNAILTTSSIEMAQKYYKAFKEAKKTYKNEKDSGWPRIAITYSLTENDDDSADNQKEFKKCLEDYNKQYGTEFSLDNIEQYNSNVADRAARRKSLFAKLSKDKEINLVIVVKRLLTGFDAPRMNTLFVDRMFEYQELIQSYSRTNRLYDRELKQAGQIVTFRKPATTRQNEDDAYTLYAGAGSFQTVVRPDYDQAVDHFKESVSQLKEIAPTAAAVDDLHGNHKKAEFVKSFRQMNHELNDLVTYKDFTWDNGKENFGIAEDEIEHYLGKFNRIKEEFNNEKSDEESDDELANLDFSLTTDSVTLVDYDYVTKLLQDMLQKKKEMANLDIQANMSSYVQLEADIQESIQRLHDSGHPNQAKLLSEFLKDFDAQKIEIDDTDDVRDLISNYRDNKLQNKIKSFAELWGLNQSALYRVAKEHKIGTEIWPHEQELNESADAAKAKEVQSKTETGLLFHGPVFIYRVTSKKAWRKFIENDLAEYLGE